MTSSAACRIAEPPSCSDREPNVPMAFGTSSVSPWRTVIFSSGTPSWSDSSIASDVPRPCPCGELPVQATTEPSGWMSTRPLSPPESPPVIST